jgi:hypothetical protein
MLVIKCTASNEALRMLQEIGCACYTWKIENSVKWMLILIVCSLKLGMQLSLY